MSPADQPSQTGLAALEARVKKDLDNLCRPPANWVPSRAQGGERVVDVVIVGGGMCGMLVWFALQSAGIRNVRIVDRSPEGVEGPWVTYARMESLRSPKHLTGPAYGMASLTFRAWFEAQFGAGAWEELDKIPRTMWMDYLRWYRKILRVPVENHVEVCCIRPDGDLLRLELSGEGTTETSILARKLIMATGREGTGHPNIPTFMDGVPRTHFAHSSDAIDFDTLSGKRVVVIGVGASAVENAAEAAEAGVAEVRMLARRKKMPTINKMMGIGSFGFSAGYAALPDEWRWRLMHYSFATQTPAPHGSTRRANRQDSVFFHFGAPVTNVCLDGDAIEIEIEGDRRLTADFLILGTGFTTDPLARTEFGKTAAEIQLWEDVYMPPMDERDPDLARFPYLNPDFTFREKVPGSAPWLANVYCFNYGATASLGKISGDIPGISEGAAWLTRDIAATLYREDVEAHWQRLQDYAKPELKGDEWTESPLPDRDEEGGGILTDERLVTLAGIAASDAIGLRADILAMTDAASAAVLTPKAVGTFSHSRRAALAARIARLNGKDDLAAHYGQGMKTSDAQIADPSFDGGADAELTAILTFTDRVATSPKDATAADIEALTQAGLAEADIVRLTQLNAFLAYEIRLIEGLSLMGANA